MQEILPLDVIIELSDCAIWQQDHLVLTNVNLSVSKGEFMYLVGRVGSGKSSLIKTLNAQIPLERRYRACCRIQSFKAKKERDPLPEKEDRYCFPGFPAT